MDRRQFVTGIATAPLALASPAAAAGTPEAVASMRAILVANLDDALRGATSLDLSGLDPADTRHGWRERVRDAAQQLAALR